MASKGGRPKSEFEDSKKDFPKDWYDIAHSVALLGLTPLIIVLSVSASRLL